jgi:hypothetical protein
MTLTNQPHKTMQQIELYSKLPEMIDAIERLGRHWALSRCFKCSRQGKAPQSCRSYRRQDYAHGIRTAYDLIGRAHMKALACLADFRRGGRADGSPPQMTVSKPRASLPSRAKLTKSPAIRPETTGVSEADGNWVKTPGNINQAR